MLQERSDLSLPGRIPNRLHRLSASRAVQACGVLLLLVVLAQVAAWWAGPVHPAQQPNATVAATPIQQLPARPADIEAHAAMAQPSLAPGDARALNAAVPIAAGPLDAARPFVFRGSDLDRTRALACLATGVLYEAGDDTRGEAAVAQVVLNRVRHPAFPGTVCGVVFQGSQRATGCQFTFTCDGSLARTMAPAAWQRAREVADQALSGKVDKSVGLATHYHTDWVYPYWSPELRKLAQVGTHLFFGWPGWWGGKHAFSRAYRGGEGVEGTAPVAAFGPSAPSVMAGDTSAGGPPLPAEIGKVPSYGTRLVLVGDDARSFALLAPPGTTASRLVNAALALCAKPGACRVSAWSDERAVPRALPASEGARKEMVFDYVRDGSGGGSLRFDCRRYANRDAARCLDPGTAAAPRRPAGARGSD